MADTCVIGRGITIKGNLTGAEELIIEGSVEGHISLKNHLTIKESGRITADITPAPNAAGWLSGSATVTFTCSEGIGGIAACSDPALVETEDGELRIIDWKGLGEALHRRHVT